MYNDFYGLRETPFNLTPDSSFFFPSDKHKSALDALIYAIQERKGFVVVTGEVGAGKTTVSRYLLKNLGPNIKTAVITNTFITPKGIITMILDDLGIHYTPASKDRLLIQLNEYLIAQARRDQDVVLLIDEAQNLSMQCLEEIRMLSNLETDKEKLIQIILMGQPELREKIESPRLEQLKQRIAIQYHLYPLSEAEMRDYVQHRLNHAKHDGQDLSKLFCDEALSLIYRYSGGIPRMVNKLCDYALLTGFVAESRTITAETLMEAIHDFYLREDKKMSKFTKALEKIQTKRTAAAPVMDHPTPSQQAYNIPKDIETRQPSWERGIRTIKEATPDKRIIYHHYPTSTIAEQYRTLRTNLKTRLARDNAKVIMLSSSINGEGKSISSINLAYSLAEAGGCKIGIIDADLRRGRIATYLGLGKNLPGLSDYLVNPELSIKEVVVRTSQENLFVIPRGMIPKNPSELLSSVRFRNLINEMSRHVDYLVIDTPPIMSVADAGIIGREVDGLVMVMQAGKTPKTVIAHAHRLFEQAEIKMYGYILTNVEFQSQDYRYYYEYYNMPTDENDKAPSRTSMFFKRLGLNFERKEEKFSGWWQKNMNKKKHKRKRSRNITN